VPSSWNWTPTTATFSEAFADAVTFVPATVDPLAGVVIVTVGGVLSMLATVTDTAADVVELPAASRATAVSECVPLEAVLVFHDWLYGAAVNSAPRFVPSSLNCTPTTALSSVAFAETVTVAETLDPAAGAVMATVGGVVSLSTVTVTTVVVPVFPAASLATAVSVCDPFATVFESHVME